MYIKTNKKKRTYINKTKVCKRKYKLNLHDIYMRRFFSNRHKIINFWLVLMATMVYVDYIMLYTRFDNSNMRSNYFMKHRVIGLIALSVEAHLLIDIGYFG